MLLVYGKSVESDRYRPIDMDEFKFVKKLFHATVYPEEQRNELRELVDEMNEHYAGEVEFEIRETN